VRFTLLTLAVLWTLRLYARLLNARPVGMARKLARALCWRQAWRRSAIAWVLFFAVPMHPYRAGGGPACTSWRRR
ncbi:hypothetical protein CTI14_40765, partial [Methylobacterium radiotolerans]